MLQEVSGMIDAAGPAWTEGIVGDIWDQILTLCHPQAVGHIQLTCKLWKQQCRLRLTQLELPPQPITELQALAAALPSIKQLRFKYRGKHAPESYMQAPQMHILREFPLLTSLTIEGDLELRPDEQKVLEDLSGLQVLSLPAGHSLAQQLTEKRLPESLTSLSITGMILDADWWNWQDMPDTLRSVHLGEIAIACNSNLTWLQQLSSIQIVSMQCSFPRWEVVDLYRLDCLIRAPNLRSVDLQIAYSENTVSVLRALSKLTSLSALTLSKGWDNRDPQLGCCPGDWLLSLKSVSSLDLRDLTAPVCIAAVSMTWLSALSMFTQGHQFATASTLASLSHLTRMTSLTLQGAALGNVQVTFLHSLADLAVCVLDASWQDLRTSEFHFKELRHGYQAMFGLNALTSLSLSASFPLGPDPKLNALALNTNLQCLEYYSLHLGSSYFIKTVEDLTRLTRLTLFGSQLPITLLGLSSLRWMKELVLYSEEVSHTNMGFVCSLRYLALLRLRKIAFRDTVFSQSEKLDKLTSLTLSNCPLVTNNIFPFIARMVSLREVVIVGCSNVNFSERVTELDDLRRLSIRSFST